MFKEFLLKSLHVSLDGGLAQLVRLCKNNVERHVVLSEPIDKFDVETSIDAILLCSDGLYNNVSETTINSILRGDDTPEQKVMELISIGNSNGGSDNLAAVVWEAKHYGN